MNRNKTARCLSCLVSYVDAISRFRLVAVDLQANQRFLWFFFLQFQEVERVFSLRFNCRWRDRGRMSSDETKDVTRHSKINKSKRISAVIGVDKTTENDFKFTYFIVWFRVHGTKKQEQSQFVGCAMRTNQMKSKSTCRQFSTDATNNFLFRQFKIVRNGITK